MKGPDVIESIDNGVREFLKQRGVRKVIAGVSGGADSVALLFSLFRNGVDVTVVNCNFHLRGEESDRDSRFVGELCQRLGVDLISVDCDVEEYISGKGGSVEMACRDLRYSRFFEIMERVEADRVAVAHNSDDRVETVLLNLFRGAGVRGLRGMVDDTGRVIRPLLNRSRKEIESYLEALGEEYIVDSTNLESVYRRNFIRNELLPLIESKWPHVRKSILKSASVMEKEERALDYLEKNLGVSKDRIEKESLQSSFDSEWIIRRFVVNHGGREELASEIIRGIDMENWQSGKVWKGENGEFRVSPHGLEWLSDPGTEKEKKWIIESYDNSEELLKRIRAEKDNHVLWTSIPPEDLVFRRPRVGDRISPLGMKGSRLVSDVISDAKLSAIDKKNVCLAERKSDGKIIWVEGLKRSRKGLIVPENKIVWRIVGNTESNC